MGKTKMAYKFEAISLEELGIWIFQCILKLKGSNNENSIHDVK